MLYNYIPKKKNINDILKNNNIIKNDNKIIARRKDADPIYRLCFRTGGEKYEFTETK